MAGFLLSRLSCPTHLLQPLTPLIFSFQVDMGWPAVYTPGCSSRSGRGGPGEESPCPACPVVAASTVKSLWSSVSNHVDKGGGLGTGGGTSFQGLGWCGLCFYAAPYQGGRDKVRSPPTSITNVHAPAPPANRPLDILYDEIVRNRIYCYCGMKKARLLTGLPRDLHRGGSRVGKCGGRATRGPSSPMFNVQF